MPAARGRGVRDAGQPSCPEQDCGGEDRRGGRDGWGCWKNTGEGMVVC